MGHLSSTLPPALELGARQTIDWGTEIVATDGGHEVRNNRWAAPLRQFTIALPAAERDDADYLALLALFEEAQGSLHSFNFRDWAGSAEGRTIAVRFDGPLEISALAPHLDQVSATLREIKR